MNQECKQAGALLTIDLDAVRDNYRLLRSRAGNAACAAVVKADAYGLGATRIAPVLAREGCRHFFVAHLAEAIALRPHLPASANLFVLHGPLIGTENEFVQYGLIPVLNSIQQIDAWRLLADRLDRRLSAVIQLDTGMSRLGLSQDDAERKLAEPDFLQGIEVLYVMSHLACAEDKNDPMNVKQLDRFAALRKLLPGCPASIANSSGIFLGKDFHFDLVRPGAALYGIAPVAGASNTMKPVVRLQGKIIQTRTIEGGIAVGYGCAYIAPRQRRISTVSVGYADGYLRSLSNRGVGAIDGIEVPLVGKVSMDTITFDTTSISPERTSPGSLIDLLSENQSVDTVAALSGTIGYEILTSLGNRYHREYVGGRIE